MTTQRIIGIDPGSRITGYGIIDIEQNTQTVVHQGIITANQKQLSDRLYTIFTELQHILQNYHPHVAAIEQVFVKHNVQSALKLGQARGAALVALASQALTVHSYSPREIKQAATGSGAANKAQIQLMIRQHFQLTQTPSADAADALAVALCHHYQAKWQDKIQQTESL